MPYSHHPYQSFRWQTRENRDDVPYSHHPYAYSLSNPVNWTDPTGKCVPWLDPTCRPVWETNVPYTGWNDFQQYSAGVVEGMGSLGASVASLAKAETWQAAQRGLNYLATDAGGSAQYLRQQLVDPVVQAVSRPGETLQALNQDPRQFGRVLGSTAATLAVPIGIPRIGSTVRRAFPGPKVSPHRFDPALRAGEGATDMLGNIRVSPHGIAIDRMRAIYHEQVHSFFTPRGVGQMPRARFSQWVYNHSHLLRYTKEAIAESVAQLRTGGGLRTGFLFPITEGYVNPWRVATEGVLFCGGTAVVANEVGEQLR